MFTKKIKNAFTMAEVLITLGIIGVVVAMTLPTVVNNARNKELEARFKQAYSQIYQAVLLSANEDPQLWQTYCGGERNLSGLFFENFAKKFQTVTVFSSYIGSKRDLKLLGYNQESFYTPELGKKIFNHGGYDSGSFVTKNGMIIFNSGCWWDNALDFVVDTNGHKGPNRLGYDVFYFQISKNDQLLPSSNNTSFSVGYAQNAGCCSFTGTTDGGYCDSTENNWNGGAASDNGTACSRFAIMDVLPGDESKSYWKNLPRP